MGRKSEEGDEFNTSRMGANDRPEVKEETARETMKHAKWETKERWTLEHGQLAWDNDYGRLHRVG